METKKTNRKLYILITLCVALLMMLTTWTGFAPKTLADEQQSLPIIEGVEMEIAAEEVKEGDIIIDAPLFFSGDGTVTFTFESGYKIKMNNVATMCYYIDTDGKEWEFTNVPVEMGSLYLINSGKYYVCDYSSGDMATKEIELKSEEITSVNKDTSSLLIYKLREFPTGITPEKSYAIEKIEISEEALFAHIYNLRLVKVGEVLDEKVIWSMAEEFIITFESGNVIKRSYGAPSITLSGETFTHEGNVAGTDVKVTGWLYHTGDVYYDMMNPETLTPDKTAVSVPIGDKVSEVNGQVYVINDKTETGGNGTHIGGGSSINSGSSNSRTEKGELSNIEICALVVAGILEFVVLCFVGMSLKGKAMLTIVLILLAGFIGVEVALYIYFF